MTTEAKPRIKITYATLSADNEELHTGFEEAVATARGGPRPPPPQLRRRRGARRRRDLRGRARRSTATSCSARSPRGTAADVDDAVAAARAAQPAWAATPWRERLAILRRAAELISDRLMDYAARHGYRGRQEPHRGARRGRGVGRPHPLLRPDDGGQRRLRPPDGQPRRRGRPHPLDPPAARRLRGHQPVQLPDGPGRRPDRAPR